MTTGPSTSAIRRLTAALLALLIAALAVSVIGANPAAAHRGPAHQHDEQRPPRQNIPPVANDLAQLGGGTVVAKVHPYAAAAVVVLTGVKILNDHLYKGYTGPSDRRGRNQPTSSRVPENAR